MSEVRVRPATPDDAAEIAHVQVASWRSAYRGLIADATLDALDEGRRTDAWSEAMAQPYHVAVVAEVDGEVVGFADGGPNRAGEPPFGAFTGELNAIYLLPTHQRAGIGKRLVRAFVDALRAQGHASMIVWVLETNPARAFYEALGGRLVGAAEVVIGGERYPDVAYGWDDLDALARRLENPSTSG
ncbi:MAG TPA: GNAT family N-acetyltransferase [Longimicrobium sp.]